VPTTWLGPSPALGWGWPPHGTSSSSMAERSVWTRVKEWLADLQSVFQFRPAKTARQRHAVDIERQPD
jgi:hypothetical protein